MYLVSDEDLEYINEQLEYLSWHICRLMSAREVQDNEEDNFASPENRALEKSNSSAGEDF